MIKDAPTVDWIEIGAPPKPYLHALRRSFPSGLHVLVLTRQVSGKLVVLSVVDHGTPQGTRITEGYSADPEEISCLIARTCEKWNISGPAGTTASSRSERRYYYVKPTGGISGAVSRTDLFQLVAQGPITWDSQVWEKTEGLADSGKWQPITSSLGFPQDGDAAMA